MPNRSIAAVLLSLVVSAVSYGQDDSDELTLEDIGIEYCRWLSMVAKDIMTARQEDEPMSETLPFALDRVSDFSADLLPQIEELAGGMDEQFRSELFAQLEETETNLRPIVKSLVAGVYEIPVYAAEGNQRRAISEFGNTVFSSCFEGVEKIDLEE